MNEELLNVMNLTTRFGEHEVLSDLNLRVHEGEAVWLLGQAGSGKSTFIEVLRGYVGFQDGCVYFRNQQIQSKNRNLGLMGVHFVSQQHMIQDSMTVSENLNLNLGRNKQFLVNKRRNRGMAIEIMKEYQINLDPNKKAMELQPYEKHIIELLIAVAKKSKLIVVDDIIKHYAPKEQLKLYSLIRKLHRKGYAFLYCSRKNEFENLPGNRIYIMHKGRMIRTIHHPIEEREEIAQCLSFGEPNLRKNSKRQENQPMVEKKMVEVAIPLIGRKYPYPIQVGPNELIGLLDVDRIIDTKALENQLLSGQGYISNLPIRHQLIQHLSAYDNLILQIHPRMSFLGLVSYKLKRYLIGAMVEETGIPKELWHLPIRYMMEYEQTLVLYKRWLLKRPKVMILMSPFSMADDIQKKVLKDLISGFVEQGIPMVILSSDEEDLSDLCTDVIKLQWSEEQ